MSPVYSRILTPQGLQPVDYQADSLADAARFEPDGIYTVTNTYNTFQALKLADHLDRMEDSAKREGIALRLDRPRLRVALRQMIAEVGFGDVRFRVTVPREQPDHLILSVEPFTPPAPELIEQGVRCITTTEVHRRNPAAKTNDWAQDRQAFPKPDGIYEVLLTNADHEILEGFTSNFYAVFGGQLRTAGSGVLPGIAQQIVFAVAPAIIPVEQTAVHSADLSQVSEAFLTSSSRGIIPIIEIDGFSIGTGQPGTVTQQLRQAYDQWVADHLEDL
jgi:branched-chain amino acid aminotransferase